LAKESATSSAEFYTKAKRSNGSDKYHATANCFESTGPRPLKPENNFHQINYVAQRKDTRQKYYQVQPVSLGLRIAN
jgi:hypothetical protein